MVRHPQHTTKLIVKGPLWPKTDRLPSGSCQCLAARTRCQLTAAPGAAAWPEALLCAAPLLPAVSWKAVPQLPCRPALLPVLCASSPPSPRCFHCAGAQPRAAVACSDKRRVGYCQGCPGATPCLLVRLGKSAVLKHDRGLDMAYLGLQDVWMWCREGAPRVGTAAERPGRQLASSNLVSTQASPARYWHGMSSFAGGLDIITRQACTRGAVVSQASPHSHADLVHHLGNDGQASQQLGLRRSGRTPRSRTLAVLQATSRSLR